MSTLGIFLLAVTLSFGMASEVFVMLALDTVTNDGQLKDKSALSQQLDQLKQANVDGVMADCWWGITEPSPKQYKWDPYLQLVDLVKQHGMKVEFVSSFHQCGGNVGDACNIPVPSFVGKTNGIWYKDNDHNEDKEYISLFADNISIGGRTPLEMYSDWFVAFASAFAADLGSTVSKIQVGMGPAGELRYPAYQLKHWSFCGIGAFQCFDDNALASFKSAAAAGGHKEWDSPPTNAGDYKSQPEQAPFFQDGYTSDYGKFFLDWYFTALKNHGAAVLSRASAAFHGKVGIAGKIAGIHWWYKSNHHAAELTAGYYMANGRNGYAELADVFAKNGNAAVDFTCLEMKDSEQPAECASGPQELVQNVMQATKGKGLQFGGENALPRYDTTAYGQIESYKSNLHAFTYLRLSSDLLSGDNFNHFKDFVNNMHNGADNVIV